MSQTPDPYKIPQKKAQDWVKNWVEFTPAAPNATEGTRTADMRAFLVKKKDLVDLMAQAPDANFVRFYVGMDIDEETKKGTPHLLMVSAMGIDAAHAKDMIDLNDDLASGQYPINDFTTLCPPICDDESPLFVAGYGC
jgi:hypothetical protein